MISFTQLSLQRGTKLLVDSVSLTLYAKQRVGIIGQNGCGKSSLFKMMLGNIPCDSGEINLPKNLSIACMAQEVANTSRSALDFVLDGDRELRTIESRINAATHKGDNNALTHLYDKLDAVGGYTAKNRAEQLMHGLGFKQIDIEKPVNEFSGGWRVRLNLAQALMTRSELLLLDEPTNHLDLDATLWLEQWLKGYQGLLLIISHDRDFLDNLANTIISFEAKKLLLYKGNYTSYEKQRAERLAQQQTNYEKQQARIKEIESFVNRFRAKATKARQAQSRLKALAKMELIAPAHIDSPFHFSFKETDKTASPLLHLSAGTLGYNTAILHNVELSILPGSRFGLLGANGAGKSTLLKTLTKQLPLISGKLTTSEHLRYGYFAQHQLEVLDMHASPVQHIKGLKPKATEKDIRAFLGGFDFQGDMATEPINHFSGGEKARLVLAIIAWQAPNLLVLDEPTNHLDLEMRHALELALQRFAGAVIVVSHDRHLLRHTVDRFLLIDSGRLTEFKGDLSDYQKHISENNKPPDSISTDASPTNQTSKKALRQHSAELRKKLQPLKNKIKQLDNELDSLNQQLAAIDSQLNDSELYQQTNKDKLSELLKAQAKLKKTIEQTEQLWLNATEELENLAANLN